MSSNNISFGKVIAVTGDARKIKKINKKVLQYAPADSIVIKDVTSHYRNAHSSGALAQSAQKGDSVEIYITGDDANNVKQKQKNWDTIDGILSHLDMYYNTSKMAVSEIIKKIANY